MVMDRGVELSICVEGVCSLCGLECFLLPIQDVFDITGDPRLVIREAAYSSNGDHKPMQKFR